MITLDGELDDAERLARGSSERAPEHREESPIAQRRQAGDGPQRHVQWMPAIVGGAAAVRHPCPWANRLAPSATAATAPGPECESEPSPGGRHLIERIL
jgi:hypothetical protein